MLSRICADPCCMKSFVFALNMVIGYRAVENDVPLVVSLICASDYIRMLRTLCLDWNCQFDFLECYVSSFAKHEKKSCTPACKARGGSTAALLLAYCCPAGCKPRYGCPPVKGACNAIRQHSSQQHKFNVMWFDAQVGIRGGRVEY